MFLEPTFQIAGGGGGASPRVLQTLWHHPVFVSPGVPLAGLGWRIFYAGGWGSSSPGWSGPGGLSLITVV